MKILCSLTYPRVPELCQVVLPSLTMETFLPSENALPFEPVMMSPLAAYVPGIWRPKKSAVFPSAYS